MRNIIITLLFVPFLLTSISCNREDFFEGAAISFYPTVIANADEEDGNTYILPLRTSAFISGTAKAVIHVNMSADGVISTIPPMEGNKITVEITNSNEAVILVTVGNDAVPDDYTATFNIVSVSGELAGIGRDKYSLFVKDQDVAPIYTEYFDNCANLNSFTPISVTGAQVWSCTNFGRSGTAARMNGFSGGAQENEDWLVSEAIDLAGLGTASVRFVSDKAFTGPNPEFKVSTNYSGTGNPNEATWTTLAAAYDTQSGNNTWTSSGNLDISSYLTANTYFAFVYTSNATVGAAQWTIDDFEISIFHPNASGGGNDNLAQLPFEDDFEDCSTDFSIPENFTVHYIEGTKSDRGWGCRQLGVDDSRGVRVNVFGGTAGTSNTWLISKNKYDLRSISSGELSFDVRSAAAGDGTLKVLYSTNYFGEGPALATWTELDIAGQLPAKGSNTWNTVTGNIPGGEIVYIGFQFVGASHANSASYDIDNLYFDTFTFGFTVPFTENFESCTEVGDFNIPTNWIEEVVPGSKTDRGWGCRAFGRNGSNAPRASAFGGTAGTDDAWLISAGPFDFTELTNIQLVFWLEKRFTGPGSIEVKWSTNYTGSGNPQSATWTTLTDVTAQIPAASEVFSQVTTSLNGAAGQHAYLAFRYVGGTSASSIAFTIDDLTVTGN